MTGEHLVRKRPSCRHGCALRNAVDRGVSPGQIRTQPPPGSSPLPPVAGRPSGGGAPGSWADGWMGAFWPRRGEWNVKSRLYRLLDRNRSSHYYDEAPSGELRRCRDRTQTRRA